MEEITLYDSNFPHQEYLTPHIKSTKIIWKRDNIRRKVNVYTDNYIKNSVISIPKDGNINVCLLLEPLTNPAWTDVYDYIQTDFEKFDLVITHNKQKLAHLIESRPDKFVYSSLCTTTCWFDESVIKLHEKTKMFSMAFSDKKFTEGHQLRHLIYEKYKDTGLIDFYGTGVPNNEKNYNDCYRHYKYTIVIENCLQRGYNSEKLYDAFLSGSVPLYWGSKVENNDFDQSALFYFSPQKEKIDFSFEESLNNFDELFLKISNADPYNDLINAITHNYNYIVDNKQTEDNFYKILKQRSFLT